MVNDFPLSKQLLSKNDNLSTTDIYKQVIQAIGENNWDMVNDGLERVSYILGVIGIEYNVKSPGFFVEQAKKIDKELIFLKDKIDKISTLAMIVSSPFIYINAMKQENIDLIISTLLNVIIEPEEVSSLDYLFEYIEDDNLLDLIRAREDVNPIELLESVMCEILDDERIFFETDKSLLMDMYGFVQDKTFSLKKEKNFPQTKILEFKPVKNT